MPGIYIHIPFCRQACHYCDFHFSTSLGKKEELLAALKKELQLRKGELDGETVSTVYFGGGTPSLLSLRELQGLMEAVYADYQVSPDAEITLEANPDDLDPETIRQLAGTPVNRLSIGIQSFFEDDLKLMNRIHSAKQAKNCLETASARFGNVSVDLIYGIPGMTNARWRQTVETALEYGVPHISAYALTVEPKTVLADRIKKGIVPPVDDALAQRHFFMLTDMLEARDFVHYEVSNFGKEGFFSRNNTAYWQGGTYLGIGPSAHSYNGRRRSWNVANNHNYIRAITANTMPLTAETLTLTDRYNEYVMTGLRTIWGVSLAKIEREFGKQYMDYLLKQARKHLENGLLTLENAVSAGGEMFRTLKTTRKGKFFCDGIASDLFSTFTGDESNDNTPGSDVWRRSVGTH